MSNCESCKFRKTTSDVNPFIVNGVLSVPIRALCSKVFIYPDSEPEKIKSLWLPKNIKDKKQVRSGVVLSIGPGFYNKRKKRFIHTEVKPGTRVLFDNMTPWFYDIPDSNGVLRRVRLMTELDILGIINCEDCEECNY